MTTNTLNTLIFLKFQYIFREEYILKKKGSSTFKNSNKELSQNYQLKILIYWHRFIDTMNPGTFLDSLSIF